MGSMKASTGKEGNHSAVQNVLSLSSLQLASSRKLGKKACILAEHLFCIGALCSQCALPLRKSSESPMAEESCLGKGSSIISRDIKETDTVKNTFHKLFCLLILRSLQLPNYLVSFYHAYFPTAVNFNLHTNLTSVSKADC